MTDIEKQIRLLESQDIKVSNDSRDSLIYLINLGECVPELVSYYVDHRSERVLEILCKVKEPHDKILLDSLVDAIASKKSQETLILLGQVIQQSPSWVPKIANHAIFRQLLEMIKDSGEQVADCIAGLLFMALLIPHCPNINGQNLGHMFETFMKCSDLFRRKIKEVEKGKISLNDVERVNVFHLGFAIREFFHALYGIYPNSFLHYLKYSVPRERRKILQTVVLPLCNGVRLHPNLILYEKDKELFKERFAHREAHDFLDDVRRVIIGLIPIPVVGESNQQPGEPDSPGLIPPNFFLHMFPAENSSSSSNIGNDPSWDELNETNNLMSYINTPPGSQVSTPSMKRGNIDDCDPPIVITSEDKNKRRRSTGNESSRFRLSFSMFKRTTDRRSNPPPYIEEMKAEEVQTTTDNDTAELAEEALRVSSDLAEEVIFSSDKSSLRSLVTGNESSSPPSVSTVINKDNAENRKSRIVTPLVIPPETNSGLANAVEVAFRRQTAKILEDRRAAVKAVKERAGVVEPDENAVVRSRSTSFLFGPPNTEEKERTSTVETGTDISENGENPNESMDGVRSRFSVTSYFSKINRQRFVSECPTIEPDTLTEWTSNKHHICCKIAERTNSCPNIIGELYQKAPANEVRAEIESKIVPKQTNMVEQFPYLKLILPVEEKYYEQLESNLEREHEIRRESYMDASRDFHNCLKELGLADKLPGKIYDDMTHITEGLPDVHKQRDILRTRLQLVNQHLMYERSCRLLHANRNRKLFAKIKQQKVTETELLSEKQNSFKLLNEKNELTKALTEMRINKDERVRENKSREALVNQTLSKIIKEKEHMRIQLVEMSERTATAEKNMKHWRGCVDSLKRRADDAEELLSLRDNKIADLEGKVASLKESVAKNLQMREKLIVMNDFRRDDERMRTPEVDERLRQYKADLEKLRKEREKDRMNFEADRARWQETELHLRNECGRSSELQKMVDRTSKLLKEHNEAAEQKFLALQMVVSKQEEFIAHLHLLMEERLNGIKNDEGGPILSIPRQDHVLEIRTFGTPIEPSPPFCWSPIRKESPHRNFDGADSPPYESSREDIYADHEKWNGDS